jgi:hypothetical protein
MISFILQSIYQHCCFGWKPSRREVRLLHRIKDDVEELTAEEMDHLQRFLLRNYNEDKKFCCC